MINVIPVILCGGIQANNAYPANFLYGENGDWKALEAEKLIAAVDPRYFRLTEVQTLLRDPAKSKEKLGWTPKITFEELVAEMVCDDLKSAERDELIKVHRLPWSGKSFSFSSDSFPLEPSGNN